MSSPPSAVFTNVLKSVIGSGVLAMPYCFMKAGLIPSLLLLIIIWVVSLRTTIQVVRCALMIDSHSIAILLNPENRSKAGSVKNDSITRRFVENLEAGSSGSTLLKGKHHHTHGGIYGSFAGPSNADTYSDDELLDIASHNSFAVALADVAHQSTSHQEGEEDVVSYMQLCTATFGRKWGQWFAWIGLLPAQWVTGISYLLFVAQNSAHALGLGETFTTVLVTILACAMVTPRTMDYLSVTSTAGNIAFLIGFSTIMYYAAFVHKLDFERNVEPGGTLMGVFEAFGIMVLSYSAHPEVLAVVSTANHEARGILPRLVSIALVIILFAFSAFSVLVYASFGMDTQSIVFDNLPNGPVMSTVRMAISVMLMANYPLVMFPIFHVFETTLFDAHHAPSRMGERYFFVLSTAIAAVVVGSNFGAVAAIVGGLVTICAFVLPPIFSLRLTPHLSEGWCLMSFDLFVVIFGSFGCVFSVASGFQALLTE
eukprot:PhM_4_TR8304/c0_g1_i1/m.25042/K14209/SLC36A, PAT; solute carrier family 36 (proton-coupled amino acid transporter)